MSDALKPKAKAKSRSFWQEFPEKEELNQYWYSAATVEALAREVAAETAPGARVAFLSTPSVYFAFRALPSLADQDGVIFDVDAKFAKEGSRFVAFDFREPTKLPAAIHHTFDFVLIDPPFITREVWEAYAAAATLLARPGAKILLSTIEENAALVGELLDCRELRFRPSIPNLVYQYALFSNYASAGLSACNPEVDFEPSDS